jgi:DNA-binding beta-propeller fold protein YncE
MVATGPFDLADRPGPGTEPGQFKDPIGVAVSADGEILVVDSGNARVQRFARDGDFIAIWGEGVGNVTFTRTANGLGPTGMTIAPDGQTWIADTWGHRVVAIDERGDVVRSIGGETIDIADDPARVDEAGGQFFGPRDIAIASDAIYVVDTGNERVQRFASDGEFVDAWGGYGRAPDQLIEPVGIAIGPDGNIYVADSGNARISIFTPNGELVTNWPVPDWPTPDPGGLPPAFQPYLAFDAEGNLYATASNAGQAVVLDRQGSVLSRVTQAGNERMAQPIGVAVAPDGVVLFGDIGRDAVLEYTPPPQSTGEELDAADLGTTPDS